MSFHNVRLPEDVERGATGGPTFSTTVMELSSGQEQRNINWSRPRLKWTVGHGIADKADQEDFIDFFYARQGRAYGFRFKDWTDYQVGVVGVDASRELIYVATGGETTVQARKPYASGAVVYYRDLTRLVADSLRVWVNGGELTEGAGFTADDDTGIITVSALSPADEVRIIVEFDVPVRFDADHLPLRALRDDVIEIPPIPLIELRD